MQKILNFVKDNPRIADGKFIEESRDYNALFYLAPQRNCLLYMFPFRKGDKVLCVNGAGGVFTEYLMEKGCEVFAWEKSMETLLLHKLRVERAQRAGFEDNTHILMYNFCDLIEGFKAGQKKELVQTFDYILAVDVLPVVGAAQATEFLRCLKQLLKPEGSLILTSENPKGVRYQAGAGKPYDGDVTAFKPQELKNLAENAGVDLVVEQCFYPFPDGYFPTSIYSDQYLPKLGELHEQVKLTRNPRVIFFDEDQAFDQAIVEHRFPEVAHTCMLVLKKVKQDAGTEAIAEGDRRDKSKNKEKIIYAKFSNNRAEEYSLYTIITEDNTGTKTVKKLNIGEVSQGHIWHMHDMDMAFQRLYEKHRFATNAHRKESDGLSFEFVDGIEVSKKLDGFIEAKDIDGFNALMDLYVESIRSLYSKKGFAAGEEFLSMFGNLPVDSSISFGTLLCGKPINIDLIPDNILETEDAWVVIDEEWGFDFEIPVNYVIYRGIHYYLATNTKRAVFQEQDLFLRYGIGSEEQTWYENMEKHFQAEIASKGSTIFSQKLAVLAPAIQSEILLDRCAGYTLATAYYDYGEGYTEEKVFRQKLRPVDGGYTMDIPVDEQVESVRFDIAENSCILTEVHVSFLADKKDVTMKFRHNGYCQGKAILFMTKDPQIEIQLKKHLQGMLRVTCGYEEVSDNIIRAMLPKRKQ